MASLAEEIGGALPILVTAGLHGRMRLTTGQAQRAGKALSLTDVRGDGPPRRGAYRGSLPAAVPTDPLIDRVHDLVQIYGTTWNDLIEEEFGDDIMRAIDLGLTLKRQAAPTGDRGWLPLSGKLLLRKTS